MLLFRMENAMISPMGKKSWFFVLAGMIVFLAASFFVGYSTSLSGNIPVEHTNEIEKLRKLTGLEISSDLNDPVMINILLVSKHRYSPQTLAVATLQCSKNLAKAGDLLLNWQKVKLTHKFSDAKMEFILGVETILGKEKGTVGNIAFWNQALATKTFTSKSQAFSGMDGFFELFRTLEPEAEVSLADRTFVVSSQAKLDWQETCLSLMMSAHAVAQEVGFYPEQFDLTVSDGDRRLNLRFSGASLKSLMQGQLTPQEFQTRIVMGWE